MNQRFAARAAIALFVLTVGGAVLWDGAATQLGRGDPRLAARLVPFDARIAVQAARARLGVGGSIRDPDVRRQVRRALARDVTQPAAIELRALQAQADGDGRRETRLFELSDAISRRSLGARTWLIQRSVNRGDVQGALEDFDIALRTSTAAPPILFPVLVRAASDPGLTAPIARLLDRRQDWRGMFLHYAVADAHAPPGVADVVLAMRDRRTVTEGHIDQMLVGELVSQRSFAEARRVYDAFHARPAHPTLVADPDFSRPAELFPFGWELVERGEAGATRSRADGRPALAYQSLPGGGGEVAVQLLMLPPGDYRLRARTAQPAADRLATPFWTLTCGQEGGPQIALLDQPSAKGAVAEGNVVVPADCPAQWLVLHLRGADGPNAGAIATVSAEPR